MLRDRVLAAVAQGIVRARVLVVALFAVLAPGAALYGANVLNELQPGGFRDPAAESSLVSNLTRAFTAGDLVVLYTAHKDPGTVDDVVAYDNIVPALANVAADPAVTRVVSFYSTGAPWLVSRDRTRTFVLVTLNGPDVDKVAAAQRLRPLFAADGYDATFGGYAPVFHGITSTVEHDLRKAELYALPLTLLLLLLLFRSAISAALPVLVGGAAVAFSLAILRALHSVSEVTIFAANVATILGLGLAIDYSLFVLMRFREELPGATSTSEAVVRAMNTAGRAVLFSGSTVAVSLCGLFLFPHGVLRSVAVGGIAVTVATVVLAMTLLPALLALLGKRVDALPIPFGLPLPSEIDDDRGPWHALAAFVMRRPVAVGGAVVVLLGICAVPFLRLAPSVADARALPRGDEARDVSRIIDDEFTPHLTTPHELLLTLSDASAAWDLARLRELNAYAKRVGTVPGVLEVHGPSALDPRNPDGAARMLSNDNDIATHAARELFIHDRTALITVLSRYAVDDDRSLEQVELLHRVPLPKGMTVMVGGQSAWVVDVRAAIREHTPPMVAFIAVAMTLVLFFVFGSVVLPIKAIAMNMLSLTASFGAIVWVFQDGRFTSLFDYDPVGTTDASVPVLMFAIVFGLSMDYEVLLLSRVREEYLASGNNERAVARGLARTGRLITSAALLLVVVVSCFATSRLVLIQTLAVGIAIAVFLDAAVVRTLLVPATMRLLGDWNWWAPRWLRRK
ncbi:MAG TPA: MMPL family transporter [Myxococcota bacterium]